jgi:hypothetical protein
MHGTTGGRNGVRRYQCSKRKQDKSCDAPIVLAEPLEEALAEYVRTFDRLMKYATRLCGGSRNRIDLVAAKPVRWHAARSFAGSLSASRISTFSATSRVTPTSSRRRSSRGSWVLWNLRW